MKVLSLAWRPVPKLPGYEVGNFGLVRSLARHIPMSGTVGP